jgi:hypothetical protein
MFAGLHEAFEQQCVGRDAPAFGLLEIGGVDGIDGIERLLRKGSYASKVSGACLMTGRKEELADGSLVLSGGEQVDRELGGAHGLVCAEVFEFGARCSRVERTQLRLSALKEECCKGA